MVFLFMAVACFLASSVSYSMEDRTNAIIALFYYDGAVAINKARIEHLDSLGLNINGKTVLETGCGGKGDFTKYLLSKNCKVTLNDSRLENIEFLMNNIGVNLPHNTWDLNEDLPQSEAFDVVLSYGTLYHLHNPENALKNLSMLCRDTFILSTATNNKDNEELEFVEDLGQNGSSTDVGCRPGYKWLINQLKKYFEFVYLTSTIPNHSDYKTGFRILLISSHKEIDNSFLIRV